MKLLYSMLVLGVAAALVIGCGEGDGAETAESSPPAPTQKLSVTLDGYPSAQNVGLVTALVRGYFRDVGLEVDFHTPLSPTRPVMYLTEGVVSLSVSHEPQVVLSREKGAPIVAVGSLISQPTGALIWLKKSKIEGIADLRGKTIAIAGLPFEESLLSSFLAQAGMTLADVKVKKVRYERVRNLISGRADAIFGSPNMEGAEIESRGLTPVVMPVQDLGAPSYDELVLIARRGWLSKNPEVARDFISAWARGTDAVVEDPKAAAALISKANTGESRAAIKRQLEATLPLLSKTGRMDPAQAGNLVDWMHEEGLISRKLPVPTLLTNDYLKPQS